MNRMGWEPIARIALAVLLAAGCSKDHEFAPRANPRDPADGGLAPPVPARIAIEPGNRQVTVRWEILPPGDPERVRSFRVYRRTPDETSPTLADSASASPATLQDLQNGQAQLFSVSSVLGNGLEGRRSVEVRAAAGLYGIAIEEGRSVTRVRQVRLDLTAPEGTRGVWIDNHPDMENAITREFRSTLAWNLPDGDGEKSVSVRFVDAEGNLSSVSTDTIRLDRRAEILSIGFDGPEERAPGDAIVFRLDAGEAGGSAQVALGRDGISLQLLDDGIGADDQAGDGVYTLRYEAEAGRQFLGAEIVGRFRDEAGNDAPERAAPRRLTVHAPPPTLVLMQPTSPSPGEISLEWSRAPDGLPFGSYRLYRADAPGVDTSATRRLVREQTAIAQTRHTDTGLVPGRVYYYRVYWVDPLNAATPSNEVSGSSRAAQPPAPVALDPPFHITESSVSLAWSRSVETDFSLYRVVRGTSPGVLSDPQRRTLAEIRTVGETSHVDRTEIEEGRTYYYVVQVVNQHGGTSASNEVSATTEDRYPTPVTLSSLEQAGESSLGLSWTRNPDRDFEAYRLYRSDQAGTDETALLLATLADAERTRWIDTGLVENRRYYYRVFVRDRSGRASPSNELMLRTANADPPSVGLAEPIEVPDAQRPSTDLSWTRSSVHDFDSYRVHRDTVPGVSQASSLVRRIDAPEVTALRDDTLEENRRYYYRVFVRDDAGASAGSNEQSLVTANRPPRPSTLTGAGATTNSISLTWSANADADFHEYRLMRGTTPVSITTLVATLTRREVASYTDFLPGQDPLEDLYYQLIVVDREIEGTGSLTAASNIVSARVAAP